MKSFSIQSLFGSQTGTPRRRRHNRAAGTRKLSFTPRLEGLEDRALLSASCGDPSAICVGNTEDSGAESLREAIEKANGQEGADVIQFAENVQGTISLTTQIIITDELTIDGPGADVLTVSGNNVSRVFQVIETTVAIDDLTIADGVATDAPVEDFASGGGLLNLSGDVTLTNVHVEKNRSDGVVANGAGVANWIGANTTVNNSTFADNQSIGLFVSAGGAISIDNQGSLIVNDSTFSGNKAIALTGFNPGVLFSGLGAGGAIFGGNGATGNVTNSRFENNVAKGGDGIAQDDPDAFGQDAGFALGGAIGFGDSSLTGAAPSALHVTGSTFSGNQSIGGKGADGLAEGVRGGNGGPGFSGAIHLYNNIEATVANSEFNGNQAITGDGGNGGADADGGDSGDYAGLFVGTNTGAIRIDGGELTVSESSFSNNVARGGNGGQGGSGGIGGDSATSRSGALSAGTWFEDGDDGSVSLVVTGSTLRNNTVIAGHGGMAGDGGVDGSDGNAVGGGLWASSEGGGQVLVTVTDVRFTGNSARAHGEAVGGAIGVEGSVNLGVDGSHFNNNSADGREVAQGGAISIDGVSTVNISGSQFVRNVATSDRSAVGGAIANAGGATLTVERSSIVNNRVSSAGDALGGGIYTDDTSNVTLTHNNVNANRAIGEQGIGGGVYNAGNFSVDKRTNIHGNKASTSHDDVFGDPTLLDDLLALA